MGVVRRGSSLYYWGELDTRYTTAKQGGGGKLGTEEWQHHMLRRGDKYGYRTRPLIAYGSIVHTDTANTYMQMHRLGKNPVYQHLGLWVTQVRHSRKKNAEGKMQPVQFVVRKKVQLIDGQWVWRKGGTQKKDGFWALVRRHISRRAVPSANLPVLREMAYMYQWLYWQSSDPIADAQAGRHASPRPKDMLLELGQLRKRLRDVVGWQKLNSFALWHDHIDEEGLSLLPKVRLRQRSKGSDAE